MPRGWDGDKRLNGRKRHLLVETAGLVLKAMVHPANVPDREGARSVLLAARSEQPQLERVWVDASYTGPLRVWAQEVLGLTLEVTKRPRR